MLLRQILDPPTGYSILDTRFSIRPPIQFCPQMTQITQIHTKKRSASICVICRKTTNISVRLGIHRRIHLPVGSIEHRASSI